MSHRTEPPQRHYDPLDARPVRRQRKPRVRVVGGRYVPVGKQTR